MKHLLASYSVRILCLSLCWPLAGFAQSHSDLLIIIDEDGVGYTAQQTLLADGDLIVSRLPPKRDTLDTVFSGPGSELFRRANEKEPDKITLISGSAFTRFRHRFNGNKTDSAKKETNVVTDSVPLHKATIDQFSTTMADASSLVYRVSWILPPNIELVRYRADESARGDPASGWRLHDSVLTFKQTGGVPKQLTLEYRVHASGDSRADACLASLGPSEWCSPDIDMDSVPDYRDLCVDTEPLDDSTASTPTAVLADKSVVSATQATPDTLQANSLGCADDQQIVLSQVQFESGQAYLNARSRRVLDKVAVALKRMPDALFRIATYTDNAGYFQNNQLLSENRANAIRHYLLLRGLGPNQIQARGFGESSPAHDNRTAEGRRANRRVELQRLN